MLCKWVSWGWSHALIGQSLCFKALVFEVSTVVTVVVDTGKLAGDTETLNDIKEIINKSKQTLLVFTKEVCFCCECVLRWN